MTRSEGACAFMPPLPCLCALGCPFLICSLLLCWPCGADQFLYLHILLSLCFQSLQPQLINAAERRQMDRRAEGSETGITALKVSARKREKAALQKKQHEGRSLRAHYVLSSRVTLHSTSLRLKTTLQGTY